MNAEAGTIVAHEQHVLTDGRWLAAHSGALEVFDRLEPTLWAETLPRLREQRATESEGELIFLWVLSRLEDEDLARPGQASIGPLIDSVRDAVASVTGWASEAGAVSPSLSLVLSDGSRLLAVRRGVPLYWLEQSSPVPAVLVASEPLTEESWHRALDGMVLAAGPDGLLV